MDDQVSAPTRLEEILAEWDMDKDLTQTMGYGHSITSPVTVTTAMGANFSNTIYTTGTTSTTAPWATFNPNTASGRISLSGKDADIEVNGWSLVDAVKRIEQRLGLYQPNPELEQEWKELRELSDKYRQLEQHIKNKQATFDRIKAMPAPEVD